MENVEDAQEARRVWKKKFSTQISNRLY